MLSTMSLSLVAWPPSDIPDENGGPTGREWGNMTRHVEEIRHDLRNTKLVLDMHDEILRKLEATVAATVAKVYTAVAVTGTLVTAAAWVITLVVGRE